jgi:hypothetical protein
MPKGEFAMSEAQQNQGMANQSVVIMKRTPMRGGAIVLLVK